SFLVEKPEMEQLARDPCCVGVMRVAPSTDFPAKKIYQVCSIRGRGKILHRQEVVLLSPLRERNRLNRSSEDASVFLDLRVIKLPLQIGGVVQQRLLVGIIENWVRFVRSSHL